MKKLLAIVALMVLGATTSFAQLGIRAGMNFDNVGKAKDYATSEGGMTLKDVTESKVGYHFGLVYNIDLIGSFAIEPGFYFTQKGFKLNDNDANMNYLEVPVNVKFKLLDLSVIGLDAHVGPFLAAGLGGKWEFAGEDYKVFDDMEVDRFDFGLQMGLGVKIVNKVYAGVNYDMSLTKVDTELPISGKNLKESNHVWMVSVGLNF